jgi:hypothetical protein
VFHFVPLVACCASRSPRAASSAGCGEKAVMFAARALQGLELRLLQLSCVLLAPPACWALSRCGGGRSPPGAASAIAMVVPCTALSLARASTTGTPTARRRARGQDTIGGGVVRPQIRPR